MKKISKVLMVALLGMVGLRAGEVKAGEEDFCYRLSDFMDRCGEVWGSNGFVTKQTCDQSSLCYPQAGHLLKCLADNDICFPQESTECLNLRDTLLECLDVATTCGDMYPGQNEQCDDGNKVDGDGCSSTCQIE